MTVRTQTRMSKTTSLNRQFETKRNTLSSIHLTGQDLAHVRTGQQHSPSRLRFSSRGKPALETQTFRRSFEAHLVLDTCELPTRLPEKNETCKQSPKWVLLDEEVRSKLVNGI